MLLLGHVLAAPPPPAAAEPEPGASARLRPAGAGVDELELPLAGRLGRPVATSGFSMVGVTWPAQARPGRILVRWRTPAGWRSWVRLPVQEDRPGQPELGRRLGTQPVWTGPASTIEVTVRGHRPRGLRLVLIDTGRGEPAAATAPTAEPAVARQGAQVATQPVLARRPSRAPRPQLYSRAAWGADPSWRNGTATYNRKVRQVHLHHTATASEYNPEDVPGIIRGMYHYHTRSLGWFDLGYNFVVDRFGRGWVGRSGGAWRPVRGAHTLGFNHNSVGIALLGSFDSQPPTPQAITKVVRIAAWKLDRYDGRPRTRIAVRSEGSDLYPPGTWARLPVIDGHRDTNQTACPGQLAYDSLPTIRQRTGKRVRHYDPPERRG